MDDHDHENRFMLDTSIVMPVAIAGGIALLIIAFVYCCRHYLHNKRLLRCSPRYDGCTTGGGGGTARDRMTSRHTRTSRVSDNLAALQTQFLPWIVREEGYYQRQGNGGQRQQYPPSSSHTRANYHSTQVSYATAFYSSTIRTRVFSYSSQAP